MCRTFWSRSKLCSIIAMAGIIIYLVHKAKVSTSISFASFSLCTEKCIFISELQTHCRQEDMLGACIPTKLVYPLKSQSCIMLDSIFHVSLTQRILVLSSGRECLWDQCPGVYLRIWPTILEWRVTGEAAIQQTEGVTAIVIQRSRRGVRLC